MTSTLRPVRTGLFETPELRVEGREKVTGQAQYAADVAVPNRLWAAFARSPYPHAKIVSIDTSQARAMAGVHAVLTAADIGERYLGRALLDWPVLAHEKVHFIGQYVAAVAAESREIADEAARAIEVTYEELEALLSPEAALRPDAPVLHEHPERYAFLPGERRAVPHPNMQGYALTERGNVDVALAAATRVFEHRFSTPRHHGGYIEPRAGTVWIEGDGRVRIVTTNKSPFPLRRQLAVSTGVDEERIVVETAFIGGDFGGKGLSIDEFACYWLARSTGSPVSFERRHLEDIESTNTRHSAEITITSGLDADGRFAAMDIRAVYDGGAFAAGKPLATLLPGHMIRLPYRMPSVRVERMSVYTNAVPAGHLRAPADVQVQFALESHVDMIARELGVDPLLFRERNLIAGGDLDVDGHAVESPQGAAVLREVRASGIWTRPLPAGAGRGLALVARHIGGGSATVRLRRTPDGRIEAISGMPDQGAGAQTLIARLLARELVIDPEWITVRRGDTASSGYDLGPGASRSTHIVGRATLAAANALREELGRYDTPPAETIEVAGAYDSVAEARHGDGDSYAACVIDVDVDAQTGVARILDATFVADVGPIFNPVAHQGQIDGGFVFGLGHALTEEVVVTDGKIATLSLADYKLPCQRDIPPLRTILVHSDGGPGPYGAKIAGEISTAPVAPAIANAVHAACGARVRSLPITAERVFSELMR